MESSMHEFFTAASRFLSDLKDLITMATSVAVTAIGSWWVVKTSWKTGYSPTRELDPPVKDKGQEIIKP